MIRYDRAPAVILQLAKAGSHAFTEKSFKRKRSCDVCRHNIDNPGAFCKGESTSHIRPCGPTSDVAMQHGYTLWPVLP